MRIEGEENLPFGEAYIICANHTSNWDAVVIFGGFKQQLGFMAKAELFKVPIIGWLVRKVGAFPIKRGSGDFSAIKAALNILKHGKPMLMFPEGTRVRNGKQVKASTGAVRLAIMTGVKIVPVGLSGKYRLFGGVCARVGKPLDFSEFRGEKLSDEKLNELSENMMETIYGNCKVS